MSESERIKSLFEESKMYIENRIKLFKFEAAEEFSDGVSEVYSYAVVGVIGAVSFFLASITAGIVIGRWLENDLLGFGIVVGVYLLLFLFLLVFRKALLKKPIQNKIIRYIFRKDV